MGRPIDARGWEFEVEGTTPDVFIRISNLKSWTENPGENEEVADTTDNDSEGYYSQDVMQRGATIELSGSYTIAGATVRDPGQDYIDKEWAYRFGEESNGLMRYRHISQDEWTVWNCTVTPGERGGETNAKTSWGCTFTRSGPPSVAPVVVVDP